MQDETKKQEVIEAAIGVAYALEGGRLIGAPLPSKLEWLKKKVFEYLGDDDLLPPEAGGPITITDECGKELRYA